MPLEDRIAAWHDAARAGEKEACFNLGLAYSSGRGVNLDYIEAHKWFNLAAQHGSKRAISHRREMAREMTLDEITLALKYARSYLSR